MKNSIKEIKKEALILKDKKQRNDINFFVNVISENEYNEINKKLIEDFKSIKEKMKRCY